MRCETAAHAPALWEELAAVAVSFSPGRVSVVVWTTEAIPVTGSAGGELVKSSGESAADESGCA
ncbi:hypothetical protein GCM10027089_05570 [Nocardia thraciensis]